MSLDAVSAELVGEKQKYYYEWLEGVKRAKKKGEACGLLTESFRAWW